MRYSDFLLDTLSIEVTRRCNMCCPHCMRGDAQDLDIDLDIISDFLHQFRGKSIRHITFTGGEPSLNDEAIKHTLEVAQEYSIKINTFSIITNGYDLSNSFIDICNEWVDFCENDGIVLVSHDKFHKPLSKRDIDRLNKFRQYTYWFTAYYDSNIQLKGRAKENNVGVVKQDTNIFSKLRRCNDILVYTGILVLNCLGSVLYSCDYVYNEEEYKYYICNYNDNLFKSLIQICGNNLVPNLEYSFDYFSTYYWIKYLKE